MTNNRIPLAVGEFYHIFNRGVAKQPIFLDQSDYNRALLALAYYRFANPRVKLARFKELSYELKQEIIAELSIKNDLAIKIIGFSFMPNHFHFLLYQTSENGISKFLSNFTNSYTRYFNTKHERVGPIFQGVFKAVRIESNEQLLHVSRYIHLNPVVSYVIKDSELFTYKWSSMGDYIKGNSDVCWLNPVLDQFASPQHYKSFLLDQIDYARSLDEIKHLVLE